MKLSCLLPAFLLTVGFLHISIPGYAGEQLVLTRGRSASLPVGTHRPEIHAVSDGSLVVAVVQPGPRGSGQVKHRVYRLNSKLKKIGKPFPITRIAKPYGEPADHRTALVNDEIVVVYQTLNFQKGSRPKGGPSEDFATDQSLMVARFSLEGEELFRGVIVDRTTDFRKDNFPDHCLLWFKGRLLVSSGTRARAVHLREVDLDGVELSDHIFPVRRNGISGSIGNSMHQRGDRIGFFSSNSPAGNGALVLTAIEPDFALTRITEFGGNDGVERHFPTDSMMLGDHTLVTYIARSVGSEGLDLNTNPYHPRLMVIDASHKTVEDIQLGKGGFAHVHPTMTVLGDQLLVAWSKRSQRRSPQVQIERFSITWNAVDNNKTGN